MKISVQNITSLYCNNYKALKRPLFWKASSLYIRLCALTYALEGNTVDSDKLLDAARYIHENTPWYSYLRSYKICAAASAASSSP